MVATGGYQFLGILRTILYLEPSIIRLTWVRKDPDVKMAVTVSRVVAGTDIVMDSQNSLGEGPLKMALVILHNKGRKSQILASGQR